MSEFEFTQGSLEAQGLQEGDEVECTYSDVDHFTAGKLYTVGKHGSRLNVKDADGDYIYSEHGVKFKPVSIKYMKVKFGGRCGGKSVAAKQIAQAVQQYQNAQGDFLENILSQCQEGDVLECTYAATHLFTKGVFYPVEFSSKQGSLGVECNNGVFVDDSASKFIIKLSNQCDYDDAVNTAIEQEHQEPQDSSESIDGHKAFDVLKGMIR